MFTTRFVRWFCKKDILRENGISCSKAFKLRLQSYLKSPQTSIKLLSPKGSSFSCRTENLMPRLFFFKMFAPKARFNSRGVSGSKPLPWHWLWPAREFCSSLSTVTAAAVTKAFAGEDVFFGKHVLFSGEGCQVDFQGRKLRFKAANLSAAPGCPQEHNSYLQVPLLNILNLHKIIQNSSKGTQAVGVLNVQWCIAIISSHLHALSICCTFSG